MRNGQSKPDNSNSSCDDLSKLIPDEEIEPDSSGFKEEKTFGKGEYEEASLKADHERSEKLKTVFHRMTICAAIFIFILFLTGIGLYAYDLMAPKHWPKLWSKTQASRVQLILLSVLASAVFQEYAHRILRKAGVSSTK